MEVDANRVIDALTRQIAQLHKDLAIQEAQIEQLQLMAVAASPEPTDAQEGTNTPME